MNVVIVVALLGSSGFEPESWHGYGIDEESAIAIKSPGPALATWKKNIVQVFRGSVVKNHAGWKHFPFSQKIAGGLVDEVAVHIDGKDGIRSVSKIGIALTVVKDEVGWLVVRDGILARKARCGMNSVGRSIELGLSGNTDE